MHDRGSGGKWRGGNELEQVPMRWGIATTRKIGKNDTTCRHVMTRQLGSADKPVNQATTGRVIITVRRV
jgi:starvation-inducible outer membrane lipoprotein